MRTNAASIAGISLLVLSIAAADCQAQQGFASGQNIAPAYEGWERNDDGSFNLVFGYMNRNWEEVIDLEIGPDNEIEPGGPDQGQPTHFQPRRNRFVFRIRVPADFGDSELVWTLTSNGRTERAYATLKPDYFMDDSVIQANNGAGGAAGTMPDLPDNVVPVLTLKGDRSRTAKVGQPITLTAMVSDDGLPRPRRLFPTNPRFQTRITTETATGLRVSWSVYRGAGAVRFDPPQAKTWEDSRDGENSPWSPGWRPPELPPDGTWVTRATFAEPGTYVLECEAHDGGLSVEKSISVVVSP
jgi:hypothetical protein